MHDDSSRVLFFRAPITITIIIIIIYTTSTTSIKIFPHQPAHSTNKKIINLSESEYQGGLMKDGPPPVVRAVEGISYSWTQHVVQVRQGQHSHTLE